MTVPVSRLACGASGKRAKSLPLTVGLKFWRSIEQAGGLPPQVVDDTVPSSVREAESLRERLTALHALVAAGELDPVDYAAATRETRARLAAVDE